MKQLFNRSILSDLNSTICLLHCERDRPPGIRLFKLVVSCFSQRIQQVQIRRILYAMLFRNAKQVA